MHSHSSASSLLHIGNLSRSGSSHLLGSHRMRRPCDRSVGDDTPLLTDAVRSVAHEVVERNERACRHPFRFMDNRIGLQTHPSPLEPDGTPMAAVDLHAAPAQGFLAPAVGAATYGAWAVALGCKGVAAGLNGTKILMCVTAVGSLYDLCATGTNVLRAIEAQQKCYRLTVECRHIIQDALAAMVQGDEPERQRECITAARVMLQLLDRLSASFESQYLPAQVAICRRARRDLMTIATELWGAQADLQMDILAQQRLGASGPALHALEQQWEETREAAAEIVELAGRVPQPRLKGIGPWTYSEIRSAQIEDIRPLLVLLRNSKNNEVDGLPAVLREARSKAHGVMMTMLGAITQKTHVDPVGGIAQFQAKFLRDVPISAAQAGLMVGAQTAMLLGAPGALTGVAALLLPLAVAQGLLDLKDVKRSKQSLQAEKVTRLTQLEAISDELAAAEADGPDAHLTRTVMHCALNQQLTDLKTRKHKQVISRLRGGNAVAALSAWVPASLLTMFGVGVASIAGVTIATGGIALGAIGAIAAVTASPLLGAISHLKWREWRLETKARRQHKDALRFLAALDGAQQAGLKDATLQAFMNANADERDALIARLLLAPAQRGMTAARLARNPYVISAYLSEGLQRNAHRQPCPGYPSPARLQRWAEILGIPLPLVDGLKPVLNDAEHLQLVRQQVTHCFGRHWYTSTKTPADTDSEADDPAALSEALRLEAESWASGEDMDIGTDSSRVTSSDSLDQLARLVNDDLAPTAPDGSALDALALLAFNLAADGPGAADAAPAPQPVTTWLGRLDAAMKAEGEARHNLVQRSLARRGVPVRNPLATPARVLAALDNDPALAGKLIASLNLTAADQADWNAAQARAAALAEQIDQDGIRSSSRLKQRLTEMGQVMQRLGGALVDGPLADGGAAAAAAA